jgi:hypothetical protein
MRTSVFRQSSTVRVHRDPGDVSRGGRYGVVRSKRRIWLPRSSVGRRCGARILGKNSLLRPPCGFAIVGSAISCIRHSSGCVLTTSETSQRANLSSHRANSGARSVPCDGDQRGDGSRTRKRTACIATDRTHCDRPRAFQARNPEKRDSTRLRSNEMHRRIAGLVQSWRSRRETSGFRLPRCEQAD